MATARAFICLTFSTAIAFCLATATSAAEPIKSVPATVEPAKIEAAATVNSVNAAPATRSGAALRDEIRAFLRDVARQSGKPDDTVVRRAVALYRQIQADTQLRAGQREPLRVALRNKLARWGEELAQQRAGGDMAIAAAPVTVQPHKTLAQIGQPGQAGQPPGGAAPPVDHGQDLLELIQDTIAPTTWDVHGGNGVVRYWAPGHALIIRQTGDVHEQIGRLLMDMR